MERIWVEINSRVNYPIKTFLVRLQANGDIDMDCPHQMFCVSWFCIRVAAIGTTLAVRSWNEHPIPGNPIMHPNYAHKCLTRLPVHKVSWMEYLLGHPYICMCACYRL